MVGHVNLREQVDRDFVRARRSVFLRRAMARLRRDPTPTTLPCFGEVSEALGARGRVYLGSRTVPAERIAGSVGRCSEFDRGFMPAKASVEERWKRINRAFHRGDELPPVTLYRLGGFYFVLDGHHRVSVARFHGVEWMDAEVTAFHAPLPVGPASPRTIDEPREHTMSNEPSDKEDPKMHQVVDPTELIKVRWGMREDETRIAELMELNGMCRTLAFEEQFEVAERGGKILAALRYRLEPKRLLLGLLVTDPWAEERPLAVALYAEAWRLAREMGVREVRARSVLHADDYPHQAGYSWRYPGGWYLDTTLPLHRREELPAEGGRRMVALLGFYVASLIRALRGAGRRMDSSR
jgi:hypothetical protein